MNGTVTIVHNTASRNGGGVYTSQLVNLTANRRAPLCSSIIYALEKGGGVHTISSSIKASLSFSDPKYTGTRINVIENSATRGGGLSLEANVKLYILKYYLDTVLL